MEPEKTPNSQSNLEKENQSRRHHNPGHQAKLQSCNHQDSMVLAQRQTLRSMEQNREPRNGPTNAWPTNLQQSMKEYPMEKRQSFQQMVLEELDTNMQNETIPLSYTIHKNKLQMMKDLNVRQETIKTLGDKASQQPL